jgi:hypothetical protein
MAASLVVPTEKIFQRAYIITRYNMPPMDELARMAGQPVAAFESPRMLRKAAVKMLGGLVVDKIAPELAEHIQAMNGVKDARLHDYEFADVRAARKAMRDMVKQHGEAQLELAL